MVSSYKLLLAAELTLAAFTASILYSASGPEISLLLLENIRLHFSILLAETYFSSTELILFYFWRVHKEELGQKVQHFYIE